MSDGVGSSDSLDGSLVVDRARVCYTLTDILSFNRDRTAQIGFINIIYYFLKLLDHCLVADQSSFIRL